MGALIVSWTLLDGVPAEDRQRILDIARHRCFARDEVVFHEGDPADSLHLIESGIFAVQVSVASGESLTLNVLSAGGFFGEMALLANPRPHRRTATVRALAPAQTLTITESAFASLRSTFPAVGGLIAAALAERVDQLSGRLLEALYVGVERRVYRRLLELAEIYGEPGSAIVIPLSQDDLALMVGASRPTVNQVLQSLLGRRIISLDRRKITIRDLPALTSGAASFDG